MSYIHNNSILAIKEFINEGITVRYLLLESSGDNYCTYSALVSLLDRGCTKEDYYIPELAHAINTALILFGKLYENKVLPCEIEALYSDGFPDFL